MLLIPAIDLKDGKCVRLRQGDMQDVTVFSDRPVEVARRWVEAGARRLHIVDLDGAFRGEPVNADVIHDIAEEYPDMPIQVGGGIRNESTVDVYIQAGVRYIIIGTQAVNEPHLISDLCAEFPTHIIIGLDAKEGRVATDGWSKLSKHDAIDMARHFEEDGVEAIIYTDIARDGMMQGVNIEATVKLAEAINIPVIASGGIHNIENVRKLARVSDSGIIGAITGRAIYEGTLDFAEGQKTADEIAGQSVFGL
ncbi:MAG: 1-(5-phosphoribosyl)-5-[(5-phosphoribosylamino)methylideneamino]imidazole-4-carboxamide isomerase [Gammaproteobacteria bacterium]|nr:1-(5-phosphoribosyl)-5-[(5-phosphoribosylamino)methylideneamino]imidazole-4-carboxamide isomerase [Gammaproteobacteria bacterium]MDE0282750.1 1-(5-phosphoribosyl)-5-[(5-phosphoribosylamino)methylideneamino]imidazole-4-carboxamide isomerase [Gammaproteobacteria bacterium]MDE0714673.1 1-(5-phosphoribosyl)-5-[(5-phosphoribosylamino)methylideneamino]imidazole-4-carboxamide isomerase [Gammaproteobacteria bacterium]MXY64384.1 1-(5-phosphoribosyl)-5-[(5-phosphoribosylamino)methylideneamino]imidazole